MPVKLNSSGGGSVTLDVPSTAGTFTATVPAATGNLVTDTGAATVQFGAGSVAAPSITFSGDTNTGIYSPTADTIAFTEGGVEAMRLDASGRVGIGTASPAQRLDVSGNVLLSGQSTADQFIRIGSGRTGNGFSYLDLQGDTTYGNGLRLIRYNNGANAESSIEHRGTARLQIVTQEAAPIAFFTNGSNERMRITSDGRVGIGTASPTQVFDVVGGNSRIIWNLSPGGAAAIQYTVNPANNAYVAQVNDAEAHQFRIFGTDKFRIDNGRVQCQNGTGARGGNGPVLTTNDSLGQLFRNAGYIEFNSDIGQIGLNYFVSDETKKDNIQPSVFSSSALIAQVNFISFDWKPESGQTGHVDVGVSAQQLQSLDGRLVKELSDGTLMVNEPALVAHLAKAVQELIAKNEALEARLAALEAR